MALSSSILKGLKTGIKSRYYDKALKSLKVPASKSVEQVAKLAKNVKGAAKFGSVAGLGAVGGAALVGATAIRNQSKKLKRDWSNAEASNKMAHDLDMKVIRRKREADRPRKEKEAKKSLKMIESLKEVSPLKKVNKDYSRMKSKLGVKGKTKAGDLLKASMK